MAEENKKTAAGLRSEVYKFMEKYGLKLNTRNQAELSNILKSVYEHRVIESRKENDAPVRHEIVCPKCQGIKIKIGAKFKNYKRSIRRNGGSDVEENKPISTGDGSR